MQLSISIVFGLATLSKCAMAATDSSAYKFGLDSAHFILARGNTCVVTQPGPGEITLTAAGLSFNGQGHTFRFDWRELLELEEGHPGFKQEATEFDPLQDVTELEQEDSVVPNCPQNLYTIRGRATVKKELTNAKLHITLSSCNVANFLKQYELLRNKNYFNLLTKYFDEELQLKMEDNMKPMQSRAPLSAMQRLNKARQGQSFKVENVEYWRHKEGAFWYPKAEIIAKQYQGEMFKVNAIELHVGNELVYTVDMTKMKLGKPKDANVYNKVEFIFKGVIRDFKEVLTDAMLFKFQVDKRDCKKIYKFVKKLKSDQKYNLPSDAGFPLTKAQKAITGAKCPKIVSEEEVPVITEKDDESSDELPDMPNNIPDKFELPNVIRRPMDFNAVVRTQPPKTAPRSANAVRGGAQPSEKKILPRWVYNIID